MKMFGKIVPILILSLLSSPLLLLQSCGDEPPYGTIVTVQEHGTTIYDPLPSDPLYTTTNATKIHNYRVTVIGTDDLPMNGIKVDVFGTFNSNSKIDSFGSATYPATAFSDKTGGWGFFDFAVVAHVYTPVTLTYPSTVAITGSTSGGSLTIPISSSVTFCYEVSAIDATSPTPLETWPSPDSCTTITNSSATVAITTASVTIAWSAVVGANGYRVYGRTANPPGPMGYIGATTSTVLTLPDNGSVVTPGASPTGTGTVYTTTGNNSISGTITVSSGASVGTLTITF